MLKVVIDTNVWVSALITAGSPKRLIDTWLIEKSFIVIYPQWLIEELRKMPSKRRLSARIHLEDVENIVALIQQDGLWIEPTYIPVVSPDPKDDVFLACAVAAKADFLITGDTHDLLPLNEHLGTKIITPAQFLQTLQPST